MLVIAEELPLLQHYYYLNPKPPLATGVVVSSRGAPGGFSAFT